MSLRSIEIVLETIRKHPGSTRKRISELSGFCTFTVDQALRHPALRSEMIPAKRSDGRERKVPHWYLRDTFQGMPKHYQSSVPCCLTCASRHGITCGIGGFYVAVTGLCEKYTAILTPPSTRNPE